MKRREKGWGLRHVWSARLLALCMLFGMMGVPVHAEETGHGEHNWQLKSGIPSTCVEKGWDIYECDTCGKGDIQPLPALDHDWDAGVVVPPTYTEEGYTLRTCRNDESHKEKINHTPKLLPLGQMQITTDRSRVQPGETVKVTVEFLNIGEKDLTDVNGGAFTDVIAAVDLITDGLKLEEATEGSSLEKLLVGGKLTFTGTYVVPNTAKAGDEIDFKGSVKVAEMGDDVIVAWATVLVYVETNSDSGEEGPPPVVKNPTPASVAIRAEKLLDGAAPQDNRFQFVLKNQNGTVLETVENNSEGKIRFSDLTLATVGTFEYTISEVIGNDGFIYDESEYTVTVEVTYDEETKVYSADVSYNGDAVFENTTKTNSGNGDNGGETPTEPTHPVLPEPPTGENLEPQEDGTILEIGEDGVPLGSWKENDNGEWEFFEITEDAVPLAGVEMLPQTGMNSPIGLLVLGMMFIMGGAILTRKEKIEA